MQRATTRVCARKARQRSLISNKFDYDATRFDGALVIASHSTY